MQIVSYFLICILNKHDTILLLDLQIVSVVIFLYFLKEEPQFFHTILLWARDRFYYVLSLACRASGSLRLKVSARLFVPEQLESCLRIVQYVYTVYTYTHKAL